MKGVFVMKKVLVPMATSGVRQDEQAFVRMPYLRKLLERNLFPVLLPPGVPERELRTLMLSCDGLLLMGGVDVNPALYGAERHPKTDEGCEFRDQTEIALVREFVKDGRPIFGICRGAQVLNVAFGGTLHQHVPDVSERSHKACNSTIYSYLTTHCWHTVSVEPDSKVAGILGVTEINLNSVHHQAVNSQGEGIRVVGRSEDGIAEFFEHRDHPFCVATQAHPEAMTGETDRLWDAFAASL